MSTKLFINLPVKDLATSRKFFAELGFPFNQDFADENMESVIISPGVYVLLLVEPYFQTFTKKEIANAAETAEVINALGVDSRKRVDELVDRALAAGGQQADAPRDLGFLYGRSFQDPDGHLWDVIYVDIPAEQD